LNTALGYDYLAPRMNDNKTQIATSDGRIVGIFVPQAAMLCCSLMHDGAELLDARRGIEAYAQRGSTMGIPLLYPWANRLSGFQYAAAGRATTLPHDHRIPLDPNGLPIHGVLPRMIRFEPEPRTTQTTLTAHLQWDSAELLDLFPFVHELTVEASVGDGALTIATTVRASGGDQVPVSFGFHPYLRLPGIPRASWRLALPAAERLLLDERQIPTGAREPAPDGDMALADASWDDGFKLLELPARYVVGAAEKQLAIELIEGFPYSQIYAPPGQDLICFEPMTAPANALRSGDGLSVLVPGEQYRAVFRVAVDAPRPRGREPAGVAAQ
jgi:aldose 1-epimerase